MVSSRESAFLLVLLLASSLFMIIPPANSVIIEPVRVYVDPPVTVDPEPFFNISVKVDNVAGLSGAEFKLEWDPTLLSAVNMTEVMFHEVTPEAEWTNIHAYSHSIDNVVGSAKYAYTYIDIPLAVDGGYLPISGNHTLAVIMFRVLGVGNCTLHFNKRYAVLGDMRAQSIARDTMDGFFSNTIPPPSLPPSTPSNSVLLVRASPYRVKNESLIVNSTFSLTIELDSIANHSGIVLGVSLDLTFDSTLLECIDVREVMFHELLPQDSWDYIRFGLFVYNREGFVHWSQYIEDQQMIERYSPIFGNHSLVSITFRVKGVGKCLLHLAEFRAYDMGVNLMPYSSIDGFFANTMNGDLNQDNIVNILDMIVLAKSFGASSLQEGWNEDADINGDGRINIIDSILLCKNMGRIA